MLMVGIAINLYVIYSMFLCARHAAPSSMLGTCSSTLLRLAPGHPGLVAIGLIIGDLFPFIKKIFAFIEKFLFIEKTEKKTKDKRKWKPTADQKLTSYVLPGID